MSKRKGLSLIIPAAIGLGIIALLIINNLQSDNESAKLPALMDAPGKVEVTVGDFDLQSQPYIGDNNAAVTVIEFSDFKCPSCKNWSLNEFPALKKEFIDTGKIKFYFINFPFLGPDSIEAALAGETIFQQDPDKFWEFKELLFEHQGEGKQVWATEEFLIDLVQKEITGIDHEQFKKELQETKHLFEVKKDFKIAAGNGIYGTPTFVVNGETVNAGQLRDKILEKLP